MSPNSIGLVSLQGEEQTPKMPAPKGKATGGHRDKVASIRQGDRSWEKPTLPGSFLFLPFFFFSTQLHLQHMDIPKPRGLRPMPQPQQHRIQAASASYTQLVLTPDP